MKSRLHVMLASFLITILFTLSLLIGNSCSSKPPANTNVSPPPIVSVEDSTRRQILLNFDRAASATQDLITLKAALRKDNLISASTELAITNILLKVNAVIIEVGKLSQSTPNFSISSGSQIAQLISSFSTFTNELTNKGVFGNLSPSTQQRIDAVTNILVLVAQGLSSLLENR